MLWCRKGAFIFVESFISCRHLDLANSTYSESFQRTIFTPPYHVTEEKGPVNTSPLCPMMVIHPLQPLSPSAFDIGGVFS